MLSKKDIQQALDHEAHRQRKQAAKARRATGEADQREFVAQPTIPKMLVVCEGENTETSYFRQLRLANVYLELYGGNGDPSNLVQKAKRLTQENPGKFEQVWCVFDRDDHAHFSNAIETARNLGFEVAWSNQSFEYWILLHFEAHAGGGMHRDDYKGRLNHYLEPLGMRYDDSKPSKTVTEDIFFELESFVEHHSRQEWAIRRARRIHEEKQAAGLSPAESESCTTVYSLVEVLQGYV